MYFLSSHIHKLIDHVCYWIFDMTAYLVYKTHLQFEAISMGIKHVRSIESVRKN